MCFRESEHDATQQAESNSRNGGFRGTPLVLGKPSPRTACVAEKQREDWTDGAGLCRRFRACRVCGLRRQATKVRRFGGKGKSTSHETGERLWKS